MNNVFGNFIDGLKWKSLERKVNKIWRNSNTSGRKSGALREFEDLKKHLSQENQKKAQDCWDKLEASEKKKEVKNNRN